jgi:hypothetical protein
MKALAAAGVGAGVAADASPDGDEGSAVVTV